MSVTVRRFRSGGWEVDILGTYPDRTPYRERKKFPGSGGKSAAQRWGEAREQVLLRQWTPHKEQPKPAKVVPTLQEFVPRFISGHAVANRQKASSIYAKESIIRKHLVPLFGTKRLDEITDEDVQALKTSLRARKPKTTNNVLVVLSKIFKVAMKWKLIDSMPVQIELVKVPPPPFTFYDYPDYARLLAGAAKHDPRTLALVLLGGDAGLRIGEVVGLDQTDIDRGQRILTVQRQVWRTTVDSPKGGRLRHIPMTAKLATALAAIRHLRGPRVLLQDDGTPVTQKVTRGWIASAQRLAGLKATGNYHVLRHTFCSHLAMKGAPAVAIKELAGHQSLLTTMRYMHLSRGARDQAIRMLDDRPTVGEPRAVSGDQPETDPGQEKTP